MYTSVEDIPEDLFTLPLAEFINKSSEWNVDYKSLMKRRRRLKSKLYTKKHRQNVSEISKTKLKKIITENSEQADRIKYLEDENQKLFEELKYYRDREELEDIERLKFKGYDVILKNQDQDKEEAVFNPFDIGSYFK